MGRFKEPTPHRRIGSGQFGDVYECLDTETGRLIAVKKMLLQEMRREDSSSPCGDGSSSSAAEPVCLNEDRVRRLLAEITLMKKLVHRNIVQYVGAARTNSELKIYMEYVAGGSLGSMIERYGPLPEPVVQRFTVDIVCGLAYLHSNRIAHRDIKCENLLLCSSGVVKVADFGCSKALEADTDDLATTVAGTPLYMAPEVARREGPYDPFAADIWTLGITVLQLLSGKPPFEEFKKSPLGYLVHISKDGVLPAIPSPPMVSAECADFLSACIVRNPAERKTIGQLQQLPFIAELLLQHEPQAACDRPDAHGYGGIPVFSPEKAS
jgi:mitogen-activated protein kinase kinase kinase